MPELEKSGQIADRPVLALVVMSPEQSISEKATREFIESATKESGTSGRTYKNLMLLAKDNTWKTVDFGFGAFKRGSIPSRSNPYATAAGR